jgi:outer membrane autotransporter protein
MSHSVRYRVAVSAASSLLLFSALKPWDAYAACTVSGLTTSCNTSAPNPWTTTIGTGLSTPSGSIVTVGPNAQVAVGNANAISLGDNANITVRSGAIVRNSATNTSGLYVAGGNTIEFRNNSTLTVEQGAQVLAGGTQGNGEAINPIGSGNTIINNGTIRSVNAAAIWFENASGLNTVINNETGIIQAPGNVIGASGNGSVDFSNKGQVIGNLVFAGGNDTLRLYTGSVITGNFNGGGGNNTIFLSGTGSASLPGNMVNFTTLYKNDPGVWTLTGTITGVTVAQVQQGTLVLTGNNTQYTGKVIVDAAGTLEARAQSLPPTVTDNGLVRFAQPDNGTYTGVISGTGAVEKTQAGTLVLAPTAPGGNTYSGGTTLTAGTVTVSADSALGAATGALTFNGGTLQLQQNLDLAASRAVTLNAPGGTIDTQGFSSTLTQGMTGPGAFTKAGTGSLTLTGANTYAGGTTISAGTLQLGNGGTSGSIKGDVANNGSLVFNRSDSVVFPGTISGTGSVTQAGTGMTVLTANNTYGGTTTVATGTLAVGDAAHPGAALSGGGNTNVAPGATLGGYGSVFGKVTNNGTIAVADGLPQFAGSGAGTFTINGQLVNAGLAQVGGAGVGNRLHVVGNYVGQNGVIGLNTYVAGDGAPSDRLVVDGGTATGTSSLRIQNVGGPGAQTLADGIQVVQATNGATTAASAFTLAGPVKAGAYSYYLAKGGVTGGTSQNWYLRNVVPPVPPVPGGDGETPTPSGGTPPLPPSGITPIPLYRPEVPIYAEIPAIARQIGIQQLDNFHDRQGDQSLLTADGKWPAAWGRVWGGRTTQRQDGTVNPGYKGSIAGLQTGLDVYADSNAGGHRNHYGLFVGYARASGDVDGFAMGWQGAAVGRLAIDAYSLGGYWTHIGPGGWYTDAVLMGSSLSIDTNSRDGLGTSVHGKSFSGSIEGGWPIALNESLTIEPQAQLLWQKVSINDLNDTASTVAFNGGNTFLGRVGVRLQGRFETPGVVWQPYVRLNLLRNFGSSDNAVFGGATTITTGVSQTAAQINAGLVAKINKSTSAFVTAGYTANLGGKRQRTVMGNAGIRWTW